LLLINVVLIVIKPPYALVPGLAPVPRTGGHYLAALTGRFLEVPLMENNGLRILTIILFQIGCFVNHGIICHIFRIKIQ
jgi:hypothetical protein